MIIEYTSPACHLKQCRLFKVYRQLDEHVMNMERTRLGGSINRPWHDMAFLRRCTVILQRLPRSENEIWFDHYSDVIMDAMGSQITSLTIDYLAVYSGADQGKHQSSASLAFVRGIHRWPVNSPHKGPVTRKMFPFDDVIVNTKILQRKCVWKFHRPECQ